ncbi:MAG TPA: hypothetical protein VGZ27_16770 [Vicinamibacterales bacterium]|jgi:hypothetical protein|nr:hypothetical protein [Vicinamibacterales bacterium]
MSAASEAFYLPALFLTVALLGGVRIADRVVLLPPPLFALVLALLLLGVLARSGAIALDRVMNAGRSALANVNGLIVILAMFLASAQVFNLVTPEIGLPRLLFSVFFLVLLLNTLAASPDRVRVLRSLVVIFGSAFVLKFVVLAALSDPTGGMLKRALLVLLEGVTLGTLTQSVFHESTGYVAFFTVALFMVGLAALPSEMYVTPPPSSDLIIRGS